MLAGGRSRRFGSDKARYLIRGQPMLTLVCDNLRACSKEVTVIAKEADLYADLGCATVADHYPAQAPLSGVLTALDLSRSPWTFVAACDLPNLDGGAIQKLWSSRSGAGVVPEAAGRLHPLAAFYHRSSRRYFQAAWEAQQLALQPIVSRLEFTQVHLSDAGPLTNLNLPPTR